MWRHCFSPGDYLLAVNGIDVNSLENVPGFLQQIPLGPVHLVLYAGSSTFLSSSRYASTPSWPSLRTRGLYHAAFCSNLFLPFQIFFVEFLFKGNVSVRTVRRHDVMWHSSCWASFQCHPIHLRKHRPLYCGHTVTIQFPVKVSNTCENVGRQ